MEYSKKLSEECRSEKGLQAEGSGTKLKVRGIPTLAFTSSKRVRDEIFQDFKG
jgi:hypothetical protein